MQLRLKRVYEPAEPADGFRVLVDRLWPRGISKERAALDLWAKDVTPSTALRTAWHAGPTDQWDNFVAAYRHELATVSAGALADLRATLATHDVVTLIYANHDEQHNHARILADELEK